MALLPRLGSGRENQAVANGAGIGEGRHGARLFAERPDADSGAENAEPPLRVRIPTTFRRGRVGPEGRSHETMRGCCSGLMQLTHAHGENYGHAHPEEGFEQSGGTSGTRAGKRGHVGPGGRIRRFHGKQVAGEFPNVVAHCCTSPRRFSVCPKKNIHRNRIFYPFALFEGSLRIS